MGYILLIIVLVVCIVCAIVMVSDVKAEDAEMCDAAAIRQRLDDVQSEFLDVRFGIKNLVMIANMKDLCEHVCYFRYKGSQPSGFSAGGEAFVVASPYLIHVFDMNGTDCGSFDDFDNIILKETRRSAEAVLDTKIHDLKIREAELMDFIAFLENCLETATAKQ